MVYQLQEVRNNYELSKELIDIELLYSLIIQLFHDENDGGDVLLLLLSVREESRRLN